MLSRKPGQRLWRVIRDRDGRPEPSAEPKKKNRSTSGPRGPALVGLGGAGCPALVSAEAGEGPQTLASVESECTGIFCGRAPFSPPASCSLCSQRENCNSEMKKESSWASKGREKSHVAYGSLSEALARTREWSVVEPGSLPMAAREKRGFKQVVGHWTSGNALRRSRCCKRDLRERGSC